MPVTNVAKDRILIMATLVDHLEKAATDRTYQTYRPVDAWHKAREVLDLEFSFDTFVKQAEKSGVVFADNQQAIPDVVKTDEIPKLSSDTVLISKTDLEAIKQAQANNAAMLETLMAGIAAVQTLQADTADAVAKSVKNMDDIAANLRETVNKYIAAVILVEK